MLSVNDPVTKAINHTVNSIQPCLGLPDEAIQPQSSTESAKDEFVKKESHAVRNGAIIGGSIGILRGGTALMRIKAAGCIKKSVKSAIEIVEKEGAKPETLQKLTKVLPKSGMIGAGIGVVIATGIYTGIGAGIGAIVKHFSKKD
ncbi:MAG: hypothetical protein A2104_07015 [Candidatus Melainabacteria bacterium GWF2_32_7]|nr:MAG: hypothetical protein A2104_07015 [Candidatus Melainabacteria bacterium GWF2_32_7]